MAAYLNGKLIPGDTLFRFIDLIHHHRLGDLYFARLPRYSEVIYYGAWYKDWFYKTNSLRKLFRVTRNYITGGELWAI